MSILDFFRSKNYSESLQQANRFPIKTQVKKEHDAKKLVNHRKAVRHESLFTAKLKHKEQDIAALIINYSDTGIGMIVEREMDLDEPVELELTPKGSETVTVKANIKRCSVSDNKFMVGAQLESLGKKYAAIFRAIHILGAEPVMTTTLGKRLQLTPH